MPDSPVATPPPIPSIPSIPSGGVPPEKYAEILIANKALQDRLAEVERAKSAAATDEQKALAEQLKEAQKAQRDAAKLAEAATADAARYRTAAARALALRELGELQSQDILRLAPEVALGDDGMLTPESREALTAWKAANPWALKTAETPDPAAPAAEPARPRTTPVGTGTRSTGAPLSESEMRTLYGAGITVDDKLMARFTGRAS